MLKNYIFQIVWLTLESGSTWKCFLSLSVNISHLNSIQEFQKVLITPPDQSQEIVVVEWHREFNSVTRQKKFVGM